VVAEIGKLKSQAGKDLVIYGHGLLGQTLLKNDLLDELNRDALLLNVLHPNLV